MKNYVKLAGLTVELACFSEILDKIEVKISST